MIRPGVQKPHWTAASSMNAFWIGESSPFGPFEAFYGHYALSICPHGQINTAVNGLSVYQYRTGSALSYLTALFHRSQPQAQTQSI